mmetsp:Transcript_32803/g.54966  ORF Transcript_32803/g.54966 Transcript_32803/m.54966 type:complete len:379 (+) Transcript_32803:674-1810(+)
MVDERLPWVVQHVDGADDDFILNSNKDRCGVELNLTSQHLPVVQSLYIHIRLIQESFHLLVPLISVMHDVDLFAACIAGWAASGACSWQAGAPTGCRWLIHIVLTPFLLLFLAGFVHRSRYLLLRFGFLFLLLLLLVCRLHWCWLLLLLLLFLRPLLLLLLLLLLSTFLLLLLLLFLLLFLLLLLLLLLLCLLLLLPLLLPLPLFTLLVLFLLLLVFVFFLVLVIALFIILLVLLVTFCLCFLRSLPILCAILLLLCCSFPLLFLLLLPSFLLLQLLPLPPLLILELLCCSPLCFSLRVSHAAIVILLLVRILWRGCALRHGQAAPAFLSFTNGHLHFCIGNQFHALGHRSARDRHVQAFCRCCISESFFLTVPLHLA